jgi:hypothetical protein
MDLSVASGSVSSSNVSGSTGARRNKRRTAKRKNGIGSQRFANYLVFGFQSTLCLVIFVLCYALVLIILWPLLQASTPQSMPDETPRDYLKRMHVPPSLQELGHARLHIPGQEKIEEMADGMKKKLEQFRQGRGVTDGHLLGQAAAEFETKREQNLAKRAEQAKQKKQLEEQQQQQQHLAAGNHKNGFIVLGMHRSGTSMLSGLLHQSAGYKVGGVRFIIRCVLCCCGSNSKWLP